MAAVFEGAMLGLVPVGSAHRTAFQAAGTWRASPEAGWGLEFRGEKGGADAQVERAALQQAKSALAFSVLDRRNPLSPTRWPPARPGGRDMTLSLPALGAAPVAQMP